ncbi:putative membrane protein (plasmid) [Clostridium sporogenes]|nr:putative membrane protein [Clostridium botulinum Prevot_594]
MSKELCISIVVALLVLAVLLYLLFTNLLAFMIVVPLLFVVLRILFPIAFEDALELIIGNLILFSRN